MPTPIKHEWLWLELAGRHAAGVSPSDDGRRQFADYDSQGAVPHRPDPYYGVLRLGKDNFDWLRRQLPAAYRGDPPISNVDAVLASTHEEGVPGRWLGWANYVIEYTRLARMALFLPWAVNVVDPCFWTLPKGSEWPETRGCHGLKPVTGGGD
ncbi:MAG: hypothetical protein AAGI54_04635 [Planctomycetota bacterium]